MHVSVGTFNLNNLFSRFDFSADVSTATPSDVKVEQRTSFSFDDPSGFKLRTYQGRLVRGKPEKDRRQIAARIKRMDLDVLAVQEVEDIDTLRQFVREDLGGLYRHVVLIEGNGPATDRRRLALQAAARRRDLMAAHARSAQSGRARVLARPAPGRGAQRGSAQAPLHRLQQPPQEPFRALQYPRS